MGKCLAKCTKVKQVKDESRETKSWEQQVLEDAITGQDVKAAVVSCDNGTLLAAVPKGFNPDKTALKNIISALNGELSALAESGIDLKSGTPVSTVGKIDDGKAIYGSDGEGGGCAIFKTKQSVLIVVYEQNPASATRLASEVAEYMEEHDH